MSCLWQHEFGCKKADGSDNISPSFSWFLNCFQLRAQWGKRLKARDVFALWTLTTVNVEFVHNRPSQCKKRIYWTQALVSRHRVLFRVIWSTQCSKLIIDDTFVYYLWTYDWHIIKPCSGQYCLRPLWSMLSVCSVGMLLSYVKKTLFSLGV